MNVQSFIEARQGNWARLSELLKRIQSSRLSRLKRAELKEFGQLYRAVSSDLACAQTHFPQSNVAMSLNALVARAHHYVYQPRKLSWSNLRSFYGRELPRLFRRNLGYFAVSAGLFVGMLLIGCLATIADEEVARVVLNPDIIDHIQQGEMWTKSFFAVVPSSLASSLIFTNNISVAFVAFALGVTFGLGTAYVLLTNGLLLGCVFGLCGQYGMADELIGFIAAHGIVEVSVILIAGAGGLMIGTALIHPGDYRRADAFAVRGADGAKLALGCAPALVLVGLVEGFISPSEMIPPASKIVLGILLGIAFYAYLFGAGREDQAPAERRA
jgi:uncharacterized membrane protein SpoIIM required for sporulation